VTVRFIGHVDEARATAIMSALRSPIDVPPFDLTVQGVGTFPENRPPRVVWAGLGDEVDALPRIEEEVSARVQRCGVGREDRPYRPHLTIARVKESGGLRARPLLKGLEDLALGVSRVEAITLFESRLSPKGPTYVPLQRTALHGGPEG
jgi:2'-5' RNA ligase